MDKVAYGTWQIVQISEINKQQTNSVEYKCSAKSLSRLFKVTRSVQCCTSDRCLSQCVCVSVCVSVSVSVSVRVVGGGGGGGVGVRVQ